MSFRQEEQIVTSFKARFGIQHTGMSNRDWFAELFGINSPTYASDIWLEFSPNLNQFNEGTVDANLRRTRVWNGSSWVVTSGSNNIPVEKVVFPLTKLTGCNNQSWMALAAPIPLIDPTDVNVSSRLRDFVKFSDYGRDFFPRIYWDNGSGTGKGTEITTVALVNGWIFDTSSGVLLFGSNASDIFTPPGNVPVWIEAYRYVGTKGVSGGGSSATKTIVAPFLFSNFTGGYLTIGNSPENSILSSCDVEVNSGFTTGTLFTVGDAVTQNAICDIDDIDPERAYTYKKFLNLQLGSSTAFRLYLAAGSPITGEGRVVLHFE